MADVSKVTGLDDCEGIATFFKGCFIERGELGQSSKL